MKHRLRFVVPVLFAGVLISGCRTVSEGPVSTPAPSTPMIRGEEPEPSPIATKDVPAGQSSLRHTQPD